MRGLGAARTGSAVLAVDRARCVGRIARNVKTTPDTPPSQLAPSSASNRLSPSEIESLRKDGEAAMEWAAKREMDRMRRAAATTSSPLPAA